MKWKSLLVATAGFALANLLVVVALAAGNGAHPLRSLAGPSFDTAFLTEMIAHHQLGVQMAQIAMQNAERDEIKQLASDLAVSQQREIRELQTLRDGSDADEAGPDITDRTVPSGPSLDAAAPPIAPPNPVQGATPPNVPQMTQTPEQGMGVGLETMRERLQKLERTSGDRFDSLFVREMIAHHTSGLEMAQLARHKASAQAVKDLADQIARGQSDELRELRRAQSELPR